MDEYKEAQIYYIKSMEDKRDTYQRRGQPETAGIAEAIAIELSNHHYKSAYILDLKNLFIDMSWRENKDGTWNNDAKLLLEL